MSEVVKTLEYAANDPALEAPWRPTVRWPWLPAWALAIAALLLAGFVRHWLNSRKVGWWYEGGGLSAVVGWVISPGGGVMLALFLPVVVKRRGLVRPLLAVAAMAVGMCIVRAHWDRTPGNWWPPWFCGLSFVAMALLWDGRGGGWSGGGTLARIVGAAIGLVLLKRFLLDVRIVAPVNWEYELFPAWGTAHVIAVAVAEEVLWIGAAWAAASWLARPPTSAAKRLTWRRWRSIAALALPSLAWAIYMWGVRGIFVAYWLMPQASAMSQFNGGYLVLNHTNASGTVVLGMLERLPWEQFRGRHHETVWYWFNDAMARVPDDDASATRLAALTMKYPFSEPLISAVAIRMRHHPKYELVPLLLRRALAGHEVCTEALVAMKVPQAAWAVLFNSDQWGDRTGAVLRQLLELDGMGPPDDDLRAWENVVREHAHGRRPPMPATVARDADKLIAEFERYVNSADRLLDATDVKREDAAIYSERALTLPRDQWRYSRYFRVSATGKAGLDWLYTDNEDPMVLEGEMSRFEGEAGRYLRAAGK